MNKAIRFSDLLGIELDMHDCEIIAGSINFFGSGQHPTALADNLDYFELDYLLECLDKGIHKARRSYKEEVTDIWCAIHMAKEEEESASQLRFQKANNSVNPDDAALTNPEANK